MVRSGTDPPPRVGAGRAMSAAARRGDGRSGRGGRRARRVRGAGPGRRPLRIRSGTGGDRHEALGARVPTDHHQPPGPGAQAGQRRPARGPSGRRRSVPPSPTIGPPIGVLPRNSMACRASTRPRISGAARSCTMAVEAVRNPMLVSPTSRRGREHQAQARGEGQQRPSTRRRRRPSCPTVRTRDRRRRATARAPTSDPTLSTENSRVNMPSLPPRSRVTNSGMTVLRS